MRPAIADEYSYSHLLALYLGDGCVNSTKQLRLTCAHAHPRVADDAEASMRIVAMLRSVHRRELPAAATVVESHWVRWQDYLPQMGPGRKHERPIVLEPWQQEIVDREPHAFLRGLIESDGCRVVNCFKTKLPSGRVAEYAYPRYFFSNESAEIRALFCASCERIGVHWTQSSRRNISVSHRDSVAVLDAFIGPKA